MKNIGSTDRIARFLVALLALILYFTKVLTGVWGIVALVAGGIFLITALINYCPLYSIFGINTCRKKA
ncbi:DUF2892 domain-containing protein [Emticicia sp. TH156]|uniref:YgaP family membrane protein n=1 Tax=Emticicia sp. TH156 TaxID=2067454 RepID=UPI000C76EFBC|nr:DUF2892 domain-containing protein [Emticicia sp. TH156]PLK45831.1 DUF2892 domain-containing protein [Emticicia sp. TH156]